MRIMQFSHFGNSWRDTEHVYTKAMNFLIFAFEECAL